MSGSRNALSGDDVVLEIRDLSTYFYTDLGVARALSGVTFDVPAGLVMGLVGESGCGKSVTALSIMRLVPHPGRVVRGEITLRRHVGAGSEFTEEIMLTDLDPRGPEIRAIRGAEIAMIFQEPMASLNPSYTVGDQIMEAISLHQGATRDDALRQTVDILHRVEMPNPERVVRQYPHELSGGMRQRAMIAMGLSCRPSVLIADEPTTALDVTTEAEILDLMRDLQAEIGMTIVMITHNLGVVAQMCDRVAVMYLGRVVEECTVDDLFYDPQHPYTRALLRSIPRVEQSRHDRLHPIQGVVPDPYATVTGCPFHDRCDSCIQGLCDARVPAETLVAQDHRVRCFLYTDEAEDGDG